MSCYRQLSTLCITSTRNTNVFDLNFMSQSALQVGEHVTYDYRAMYHA